MDLIVSRPGGAPVVQDYLAGQGQAPAFFGRRFDALESYADKAREVDGRFDRDARERAVEALWAPEHADPERIERFVERGGYMVTTGQQPGLYGGPLYSLYKGLTVVRLAEALEAALGKPVLPLFWVGSEDHDWFEANHADVITVENELRRFELSPPDEDIAPPLHRITLGAEADGVLASFLKAHPSTEFSEEYLDLVARGFAAGSTIPSGFQAFYRAILGPFGLCFTDAADPVVKERSHDVLFRELDRSAELEGVLASTAEALGAAGYDLQVPLMDGGVNLFLEGPAGRERLYREERRFRLRSSGEVLERRDIEARVAADPRSLSPNVLLRPVVESTVFPTLAYVGGPGEMAYFAQLRAYFEAHGLEMPIIFPRWAATIVETKIDKVLSKFGVGVDDLNRPFHELASEIAREEVPEEVRAALGKLRGALGAGVSELQKSAIEIDPTLKGSVQHFRSQAFSALEDVEKKVTAAVKRENEVTLAQLAKAQLHLFPHGKPAERVLGPPYFLTRYGSAFVDRLFEAFEVNFE
jgi:bacillithiol biosynthesis cysteine-adding enzyme BshC